MEPENTTPAGNGSRKKILIIALVVVLVAVVAALGYLFMQKDTPDKETEVFSATGIEVPLILSKEERVLVEKRIDVSSTVSLTKKEMSALGQRDQDTKGISTLTEEEKATIEERILVQ